MTHKCLAKGCRIPEERQSESVCPPRPNGRQKTPTSRTITSYCKLFYFSHVEVSCCGLQCKQCHVLTGLTFSEHSHSDASDGAQFEISYGSSLHVEALFRKSHREFGSYSTLDGRRRTVPGRGTPCTLPFHKFHMKLHKLHMEQCRSNS